MKIQGEFRHFLFILMREFEKKIATNSFLLYLISSRGEPQWELDVHVFGIMWNYSGIH